MPLADYISNANNAGGPGNMAKSSGDIAVFL